MSILATWGGCLKSVDKQGILEGDAIVFGSEDQTDSSIFKDYFTSKTFVHPEDSFVTPLFFEHCFGYSEPIGKATMYKTNSGWKAKAELDLSNPIVIDNFDDINDLKFGFSTGAAGHCVRREKKSNGSNFIKQWAIGELSITRSPAEPRALIREVKSIDEYYLPTPLDHSTEIDPEPEDESNILEQKISTLTMENEALWKMVNTLIDAIAKKSIEDVEKVLTPKLDEITKSFEETVQAKIDELKSLTNTAPQTEGDENAQNELTVLKSDYDAIVAEKTELQSSLETKEALLSEKMALSSEQGAELDTLKTEVATISEQLTSVREENEALKSKLSTLEKASASLAKQKFTF